MCQTYEEDAVTTNCRVCQWEMPGETPDTCDYCATQHGEPTRADDRRLAWIVAGAIAAGVGMAVVLASIGAA